MKVFPYGHRLFGLLVLHVGIVAAYATEPSATQVAIDADLARETAIDRVISSNLGTEPAFAPWSPGDSDLGEQLLLTRSTRYKAFTFFGTVNQTFTTNAFLTNGGQQSDWFTTMQVGGFWLPHLTGNLYGDVSVRQQLFRYARFSELSFNSLDTGAGLVYVVRQLGDLSVSAKYHYNLLTNASSTSEIFHEHSLRFIAQKPWILSRAHWLNFGATADIVLAGEPDYSLRHRFFLFTSYQAALTRSLSASLFYQIGYLPFLENNRSDWNQILGFSFIYNLTNWFSLNASVNASFNRSNDEFFDYDVLNTGVGVNALIRF